MTQDDVDDVPFDMAQALLDVAEELMQVRIAHGSHDWKTMKKHARELLVVTENILVEAKHRAAHEKKDDKHDPYDTYRETE